MQSEIIKAREVLVEYLDSYFSNRDVEKTCSFFLDNSIYIGTGAFEIATNKNKIKDLLISEISSEPLPIDYTIENIESIGDIDNDISFYCNIIISKKIFNEKIITIESRLSISFKCFNDTYRIYLIHFSIASNSQEDNEFYPIKFAEQKYNDIKKYIKQKSIELLNSSIAGGVIGTYIENDFPFFYINNQMISHLGYECYDDFIEKTKGVASNCIHPYDRNFTVKDVLNAFNLKDEYEFKLRLLKKDGSFIWTLCRVRKVVDMDLRNLAICVCIDLTETMQLQEELQKKTKMLIEKNKEIEQFYHTIISGIAKIANNKDYTFICGNSQTYSMLGYTDNDYRLLIGKSFLSLIDPSDFSIFKKVINSMKNQDSFSYKLHLIKKDSSRAWVRLDGNLSSETFLNNDVYYCMIYDISDQEEKEILYIKQKEYTSLILSSISAGTYIVYDAPNYPFAYIGENLINFLGYTNNEFENCFSFSSELPCNSMREKINKNKKKQLKFKNSYEVEYQIMRKDGTILWVVDRGNKVVNKNGAELFVCIVMDISQRKVIEEDLLKKSRIDSLTEIYNRGTIENEIKEYLDIHCENNSYALFVIDVDDFKKINDTLGHTKGDSVLQHVASILNNSFRDNDIVGRLGGDEFIVFMKNVNSNSIVYSKASYICNIVDKALNVCSSDMQITISIGAVLGSSRSLTFSQLYGYADKALYEAKNNGKNTYRIVECN